ncbi:hypothetical protein AUF78_00790 [archaeon 13_1_20CM_2_51_12]|nr:MAG: hypothetical protein AUF78_00790 [archaeon 13_1_20CM_2_51_12]
MRPWGDSRTTRSGIPQEFSRATIRKMMVYLVIVILAGLSFTPSISSVQGASTPTAGMARTTVHERQTSEEMPTHEGLIPAHPLLTNEQSSAFLDHSSNTTTMQQPRRYEFASASSSGFFYVGAFINSNSDPSAVPNSGVQATIQVVSQQVTGCLSFWVDDDAASNIWGQVGYYICNSSVPVAFYQVWNLTTNQVLTTGTTSVTNGYHQFSMHSQNAGNTWVYSLDGNVFGTYNMGASISSSTNGISAAVEEGYVSSPYQPAQQVEFSPALQVMQSGIWYTVHLAYEPWGCGSNGKSCWGIEGNLQNPALPSDTIVVGGNTSLVSTGAWLWNSGTPDFTVTARPTSVTVNAGVPASSTITVIPINDFTGTVTLMVTTNSSNLSCNLSSNSIAGGSGTSNLSCNGSVLGNYLATVTGASGALSHSVSVDYHVTNLPAFTLAADPAAVIGSAGVAGSSTITVTPQNGFTGTVTLAVTTNSTGLSCNLSSTAITGGTGTSRLSCTGSPAGNYLATVAGTSSGATTQTATVAYQVQDFMISANPIIVIVNERVSGTSTITLAPVNGFTGAVTLATSPSTGLTCTLSVANITLGSSQTSTLSCGGAGGTYNVTVTGTSGTVSHSARLAYTLQDFTISASPTSLSGSNGASLTSLITISPVGGFTGTVTLTVIVSPSNGLSCILSTTMITAGSGTSMLSCTPSTSGTFMITVSGTSGPLTRSASLSCKSSAPYTTIQSYFYGLAVGGAAALILVLALAIHRTRKRDFSEDSRTER